VQALAPRLEALLVKGLPRRTANQRAFKARAVWKVARLHRDAGQDPAAQMRGMAYKPDTPAEWRSAAERVALGICQRALHSMQACKDSGVSVWSVEGTMEACLEAWALDISCISIEAQLAYLQADEQEFDSFLRNVQRKRS
jgi:hypothetical protein